MKPILNKNMFSIIEVGKAFESRLFMIDNTQKRVSMWSDVPFIFDGSDENIINAIIETPRYTLKRFELLKNEPNHPIAPDLRKNRFDQTKTEYRMWSQFGFFNYGFIPQTWENVFVPNKEIDSLIVIIFNEFVLRE